MTSGGTQACVLSGRMTWHCFMRRRSARNHVPQSCTRFGVSSHHKVAAIFVSINATTALQVQVKVDSIQAMALLRLLILLFLCSSLAVQGRLLGCMTGNSCMGEEEMAPPAENGKNIKMEEMKGLRPLERRSRGDLFGLNLRWVPSGPDPLHHSGSPRKPRTP